jgi:hypothetical protein
VTKIHELKCWPEYFAQIVNDTKTFEIRKDDRGFQVGDFLRLREWEPEVEQYSGRECTRQIVYIMGHSAIGPLLASGYVCMSLRRHEDAV